MAIFSSKQPEKSPTQKVEEALGVFTQAKNDLQSLKNDFDAEKAILEDQLREVSSQGDRIEATLSKLKDLVG